jgi:hypothetical protein
MEALRSSPPTYGEPVPDVIIFGGEFSHVFADNRHGCVVLWSDVGCTHAAWHYSSWLWPRLIMFLISGVLPARCAPASGNTATSCSLFVFICALRLQSVLVRSRTVLGIFFICASRLQWQEKNVANYFCKFTGLCFHADTQNQFYKYIKHISLTTANCTRGCLSNELTRVDKQLECFRCSLNGAVPLD